MTVFRIEYLDDGPDARGRRLFMLHWDTDHGPRVQAFFTDPARYPDAVEVTQ